MARRAERLGPRFVALPASGLKAEAPDQWQCSPEALKVAHHTLIIDDADLVATLLSPPVGEHHRARRVLSGLCARAGFTGSADSVPWPRPRHIRPQARLTVG